MSRNRTKFAARMITIVTAAFVTFLMTTVRIDMFSPPSKWGQGGELPR